MASSSTPSSASPFIPSASSSAPIVPNIFPRHPPLAVKPAAINVMSTDIAPKSCSMMSKEWIIPPRPKPGRKPATDTPPTKRKAQNRAAQRAFRERRAARVSELEEQMRQVEEEHDREISRLKSQIDSLSVQLQQYQNETGWWERRCQNLEGDLQVERNAKDALIRAREEEKHQRELAARQQEEQQKQQQQQEREQQQQHHQHQQRQSLSSSMQRDANPPSESQQLPQADVPIQSIMAGSTTEGQDLLGGCNNCSMDRCKCIDDAFNVPDASGTGAFGEVVERESYSAPAISRQISQEERRQHQVRAQSEQQQQHKNQQLPVKSEYEEMEIDFTEQFTSKRPAAAVTAAAPPPAPPPPPPPPPAPPQATSAQQRTEEYMFTTAAPSTLFETCGFCQDGTPCPCAEMAAEEQQQRQQLQLRNRQIALQDLEKAEPARLAVSSNRCVKSRMPTIQSLSHMTPPPSESDVFSEALPPISLLTRNTASSCGANGPGTCSQCQSDPRSTLFCKSLAAARALTAAKYSTNGHGTSTSTVPAPVSSPSGGCCGGGGRAGGGCCKDNQRDPTAAPPLTLSCADTFTTLSRHPQFLRATDEMDTWMPRLITLPNPAHLPGGTNSSGGVNIGDRPAMEVEAASVMNVLRYFDRRFSC